ncbi:hypothetical protein MTsN2n6_39720 [Vibrio fortis]|jgi:hypothetical protein
MPDFAEQYGSVGADAAYLALVQNVMPAGFGILAMALIPNEITGRALFLLRGSIVLSVGVLLVNASRGGVKKLDEPAAMK